MTEDEINKLTDAIVIPFYQDFGFWIGVILGLVSIFFSFKAFREAKKAKNAASEAGKTVKIQTITIELNEIAQRLDKLDYKLSFYEARDLLNEVSRRLRRLIAPFQLNEDMREACEGLKTALDRAKIALDDVQPTKDDESPASIYFATQGHFSSISGLVAEIMGLFEKRTIEVPDDGR